MLVKFNFVEMNNLDLVFYYHGNLYYKSHNKIKSHAAAAFELGG